MRSRRNELWCRTEDVSTIPEADVNIDRWRKETPPEIGNMGGRSQEEIIQVGEMSKQPTGERNGENNENRLEARIVKLEECLRIDGTCSSSLIETEYITQTLINTFGSFSASMSDSDICIATKMTTTDEREWSWWIWFLAMSMTQCMLSSPDVHRERNCVNAN